MSRFFSALPVRTNLFYNSNIFMILVAGISLAKCHDEIRYSPKDCEKVAVNSTCPTQGEVHTFSVEFFQECQTKIQSYDISLKDHPFNLKQMCLVFPDLGSDKELCVEVKDENRTAFAGLAVALLLIVLLDVIGIGVIIYSCCCQKHPPPPPPPPAEDLKPKNQPTVIMIQTVAAAAPAKKDEEA